MSWEDWASVCKLSDMWLLSRLRQEAISKVTTSPKKSDEWIAVLKWSSVQHIPELRTRAIRWLAHKVQGISKIELAKEYKISDWLIDGYKSLVERHDEISTEEESHLGRETISKLFRIRDRYLRSIHGGSGRSIKRIRDRPWPVLPRKRQKIDKYSVFRGKDSSSDSDSDSDLVATKTFDTIQAIRTDFEAEIRAAEFVI